MTGRGDTLVVDAAVWDDVRSLAGRLKTAARGRSRAGGAAVPAGAGRPAAAP